MKNQFIRRYAMPVGMLCMTTSLIIRQFDIPAPSLNAAHFAMGMLAGISLPLIIGGGLSRLRTR